MAIRICLFSPDTDLPTLLASTLGREYHVESHASETVLARTIAEGQVDILLLDLDEEPQDLQGHLAVCRRLIASSTPCVVMASDALRSAASELVRLGAQGYCRKPPSVRDLKILLRRAYEHAQQRRKLAAAQSQLEPVQEACDQMIGNSSPMQRVYEMVHQVADIHANVLVIGESGTGKELIAQAIHNLGSRARKPFVAVCCGAIPETLIESELFGHEKGAFTGTVGAREGYLEQAGDGTLFLDEIGELSLNTQVKLLRVLQQREFSRLGSNRLIPLRARLIFATHRDLGKMVAEGSFRQDLYYRINVVKIEALSLREHGEDISVIARHFVRQYSEQYGKMVDEIEPRALAMLESYAWPGNVRELENVIQRAIIVAKGCTITAEDLPSQLREQELVLLEDESVDLANSTFERQIREFKLKLATDAIREHNGNKTLAAKSLQISRAYLHRLIRPTGPTLVEGIQMPSIDEPREARLV